MRETRLGVVPLVVSRTGWSGELGYELDLRDARFGGQPWERIMAAGAPHGIVVVDAPWIPPQTKIPESM